MKLGYRLSYKTVIKPILIAIQHNRPKRKHMNTNEGVTLINTFFIIYKNVKLCRNPITFPLKTKCVSTWY